MKLTLKDQDENQITFELSPDDVVKPLEYLIDLFHSALNASNSRVNKRRWKTVKQRDHYSYMQNKNQR